MALEVTPEIRQKQTLPRLGSQQDLEALADIFFLAYHIHLKPFPAESRGESPATAKEGAIHWPGSLLFPEALQHFHRERSAVGDWPLHEALQSAGEPAQKASCSTLPVLYWSLQR